MQMPGLLLAIVLALFFGPAAWGSEPPPEVQQAAEAGLGRLLQTIPPGQEGGFGFENRGEMAAATLGPGWPMLTIPPGREAPEADPAQVLVPTGEWRFPVEVAGKMRLLLTVAATPEGWQAVGLGGAGLAAELQTMLDAGQVPGGRLRGLVRLYAHKADFALAAAPNSLRPLPHLLPLGSAAASFPKTAGLPALTLPELLDRLGEQPPALPRP